MAKKLELEVGNLVCRFGEKLVLNDLLEEVVIPAFFKGGRRSVRDTEYFFFEPKLIYLDGKKLDSLALCCRFVKNTILRREQVFEEGKGIVSNERSMKSAPTSVAILLLKSHRLLFVKEVAGAPSMAQFASTFRHFLKNSVLDYHMSLTEPDSSQNRPLSRKEAKEKFPIPDLQVTPITSKEALKTFIERFEKITSLSVEVRQTNNEIDNEEFFEDAREVKEQLNSTKYIHSHTNPKGLDKAGCLKHVDAAKQGHLEVTFRGKDHNGDDIKGDNADFSVKASLGAGEIKSDAGLKRVYNKYEQLRNDGVVTLGEPVHDYAEKLREAFNLHG